MDVDLDSQASQRPIIFHSFKKVFGADNVINIATFKTEGTKSALLTACRGLGIDIDTAQEISDMIPSERGFLWKLNDCFYGNEELERKPIKEFITRVSGFPMLKETALKIEGLVCGRSSHASGMYIFKQGVIEQNSFMKTPSGQLVTCWSMNDSDYTGGLKFDILTIEAEDKLRRTFDLLLEYGKIQWQGSLRETYNKYLHPDVLEFDAEEMWEIFQQRKVLDAFQYETMVGQQAIEKTKPSNIFEMAVGNSLMRLMSDGEESPLDKYARFKSDITQWYEEMKQHNLAPQEQEVLKKHLALNYGIAGEQEDVMVLSMDEQISNFSVAEANVLRKAIGKKKADILAKAKEMFFTKGKSVGTSQRMLDYVWDYCIMPQAGYAFSKNHSVPYSVIGLQELNLVYKYGQVFWNTGCLTVNSGYMDEDNSDTERAEDSDESDEVLVRKKNVKYGKIAKAICDIQKRDIKVLLPDINKAKMEFTPDAGNDAIIFGLKSISGIGEDVIKMLVDNRPYNTLKDIIDKNNLSIGQVVSLTKAGCFDNLSNKSRKEIMHEILSLKVAQEKPSKEKINMQNFQAILNMGMVTGDKEIYGRFFKYRNYIKQNKFKSSHEGFVELDDISEPFFKQHFESTVEHVETNGNTLVNLKAFEKIYKKKMEEIKPWLESVGTVQEYNQCNVSFSVKEIMETQCQGTVPQWEMSALNFYYSKHELSDIDYQRYGISHFNQLPEEPLFTMKSYGKKEFKQYELSKICGTVIDVNKTRHIVYLLTTDGVVNIKLYSGAFVHYNKQISKVDSEGKKTVLERSWFKRGTKLLIAGFRRGDYFYPRKYFKSVYQHTVSRIIEVQGEELEIQFERERV